MNVVTFQCPQCRASIEAPAEMAGHQAECPACQVSLRVPLIRPDVLSPLETHLPLLKGVGRKTAEQLRQAGIRSWHDIVDPSARPLFSARRLQRLTQEAETCLDRFAARDALFFDDRLPSKERWRLFPVFRPKTAYLDIETTGLSPGYHKVTTIALYDGATIRHYVNGRNLDRFCADLAPYDVLVTYNGIGFDVPFLEAFFGIRIRKAHIDLRYVLASLGYSGGMKGCEQQLGLARRDSAGIDGFMAVRLWTDYQRTKQEALLETLLAYNVEDTVNLERLLVIAHNLALERAQHPSPRLPAPTPPPNPFRVDASVVRRYQYSV